MTAVEQLTWHYEHPFAQAAEKAHQGIPIAGMTSDTVPWEILRAAGYFPLMLNPLDGPTPFADRFMEDGVFSPRIRGIFDGIASNAWPFLRLVVIPRTSEHEHKLFLYLREIARQQIVTGLPELYLYNLLRTQSPEAQAYSAERTRELANHLHATDLRSATAETNRARDAVQKLHALREGPEPRLSGTEAMALIGAMYFMDRIRYAHLAEEAADEISKRPPLKGYRILIKGSPLYHRDLHRAIESQGAIVIAEDDCWGSRATTTDISKVDAVVFYFAPEDAVLGWDYPAVRDKLEVPSVLLRNVGQARDLWRRFTPPLEGTH